jgi:hypothetical protein
MKKTITKLTMALSIATTLTIQAQTTVTFDTFTLSPNSYYQDNASTDFSNGGVNFQYEWSSFGYWSGGTAYTNLNDTIDGTYTNLYGNITGSAFGGNNYATAQTLSMVTFSNNVTAVSGFYVTNTTFAWKVIKKGNAFSRRFGDTTGTGSGTSIAQGEYPDWFKLLVRGFRGGNMLPDSVEFYLADYRAAGTINDYVVKNWQFVNCAALGQVDSIQFDMRSSDVGSFGINTPTYFSMDNFVTQSTVGVKELSNASNLSLFPNPTNQFAILNFESNLISELKVSISDVTGKEVQQNNTQTSIGTNQIKLNTESLESGVYFVTITDGNESKIIKLIKL